MTQSTIRPLDSPTRGNWIRLRTMIWLRWVAIIGQLIAISVAQMIYGLQLELGLCYLAIGASVIANLIATFLFPENKRLTEKENLALILFDQMQLGFLLYLTGGLNNPFALLVLGPVTISAAALSLRSNLVLGANAIVITTVLAQYYLPLITQSGEVLEIPQIFIFGHWIALLIAIVFTSAYSRRVTTEVHSMADALAATQMALAREQKLTDLGGVVAAAAHELGTPLATIKLTSAELMDDLADHPELADLVEDAALIRASADRCRDILRDMGRAGKDDLYMRHAPLEAVVQEAADPHLDRGKTVHFEHQLPEATGGNGVIERQPEIIHGLRNLIQNAVDFARSEVWVQSNWETDSIVLRIIDDGPGFPSHLIGRIGDPFMRSGARSQRDRSRPDYEGMGLGLFIAKTLLERSGASLRFTNKSQDPRSSAVVEVIWPLEKIARSNRGDQQTIGQNQPIMP